MAEKTSYPADRQRRAAAIPMGNLAGYFVQTDTKLTLKLDYNDKGQCERILRDKIRRFSHSNFKHHCRATTVSTDSIDRVTEFWGVGRRIRVTPLRS